LGGLSTAGQTSKHSGFGCLGDLLAAVAIVVLGLHGASADRTSRRFAIDIDLHDEDDLSVTQEGYFTASPTCCATTASPIWPTRSKSASCSS
jgi:hypothetical protein